MSENFDYAPTIEFLIKSAHGSNLPLTFDEMDRVRQEIFDEFNSSLLVVAAYWTADAIEGISYRLIDDLEVAPFSSAHFNRARRILGGRYLATMTLPAPGFTLNRVPKHRSSRRHSIEQAPRESFEMQLAIVIDMLVYLTGDRPKRDGDGIRNQLIRFVIEAISLNAKGKDEDGREGQAAEFLRQAANRGRRALEDLQAGASEFTRYVDVANLSGYAGLKMLAADNSIGALRDTHDPQIRRELSLLFVLAQLAGLAKRIHQAQLDLRREEDRQKYDSMPVAELAEKYRIPDSIILSIVEGPQTLVPRLETLAVCGFPAPEYSPRESLTKLMIEIARRFELNLLSLFPSMMTYEPPIEASRAISAYERRQVLPEKSTLSGMLAYWGIRAMLDDDVRLDWHRKPARTAIGPIPDALKAFAASEKPDPIDLRELMRFSS